MSLLALVLGLILGLTTMVSAGVPDETCADCHEEIAAAFGSTGHSKYFAASPSLDEYACEACHGDGTAHVEDADPAQIINPAKTDMFGGAELCMTCHDGSQFDDWAFSHHKNADVSCASCHKVHSSDLTPTAAKGADMCYDCHSDVRAAAYMPSHHPVAEGKMSCQDCHNPHGGDVALAMGSTTRELCFGCHAEIEGPHVYEHAPVNEDCMLCHSPHGTVADKLLKQNEPALCLNCHGMHFHATVESVPGDWNAGRTVAPDRSASSTLDSWKSGMLTKCT
ncbi:MAG: DmsE family decaheme c-type cytochrome, partial [bacterium]|nr:DmsE family decaheme c-type cytochrome [bacterium]